MILKLILKTKDAGNIGIKNVKFFDSGGALLTVSSPALYLGTVVSGLASDAFNNGLFVVTTDSNKSVAFSLELPLEPYRMEVELGNLEGGYSSTNLNLVSVLGVSNVVNNRQFVYEGYGKFSLIISSDVVFATPELTSEISNYTTGVYLSGTYSENGKTRYAFTDSSGTKFFNFFKNRSNNNYIETDVSSNIAQVYGDVNIINSSEKLKEQSSLANLYEQQAPSVINISVTSQSSTKTSIKVETDKNCQVIIYIINQDALGNEQSFRYFARDMLSSSKVHNYSVDKFTSKSRVVAVPINTSFSKDFNVESEVSGVQTYNYSTFGEVLSRYQEGYDSGYKQAHQEIYPLGQSFGWNYDFGTRNDYGNSTVQSSFVQTITDNQYIGAYKEVYNKGIAYGFTYDSTVTSRTYYPAQQDRFVSSLLTTASIPVYKSFYDSGVTYGFSYNASSQDLDYLNNLKSSFISTVDAFSDKRGEKRAYSDIFKAGSNYQTSIGMAEGFTAWQDITTSDVNYANKTNEFVRHLYNSGYAKSAQLIYNSGATYGFNWRTVLGTQEPNTSSTLNIQYDNLNTPFIVAVTATAKSEGMKSIYDYVASRFTSFVYDSTNTAGSNNSDYVTYLSGIKQTMLDSVVNESAINVYNTVFGRAATDFLFSYNNASTDSTYYRNKISDMLGSVYNYGTVAAFQSVYDRGENYYFKTVTNYATLRDARFNLKSIYNNASTTQLESLKEDFEIRMYESGVVFTYKRFFDLAAEFGFTYDQNQYLASYYDSKREQFLDIYRSGNLSEGIRYVLDLAYTRYGVEYTFSPDSNVMKAQILPMFNSVDLFNSLKAYNYTLNAATAFGYNYVPATSVTDARDKVSNMLTTVDNKSALEAYNYVLTQANTRDNYTLPTPTTSKTVAQSRIIPMFKYVEDYKEADGYRRVHNYAKNFLEINYDFQDSQDPRELENQVPELFDFLVNDGGTSAYRYIYGLAEDASNFTWTDGNSSHLKSQSLPMINYLENYFVAKGYRGTLEKSKIEENFQFVDSYFSSDLVAQVTPMFEWIKAGSIDIISVSEPVILPGGSVRFKVTMKREGGLMGLLKSKYTGEVINVAYSKVVGTQHDITFTVSSYDEVQNYEVSFIPTARNLN